MSRNLFVFTVLFVFFQIGKSQDCTDYHQFQCTYADYTFFYSQQSKSMLFMRGQTHDVSIIAYAGEDYYITVCAHHKFGDLQFKIFEDNSNHTLIYDNSLDNYSNSIVLSNQRTRNLIIEVTVPIGKGNERDRRCVGVLVEFKKTEQK